MRWIVVVLLAFGLRAAIPAPALADEISARQSISDLSTDDLFARLRVSPESRSAEALEREIVSRFHESGSDTVDLLFSWALEAMQSDDASLATDMLDQVILLKPDFPEAWNKRATVSFMRKDYGAAISDLHHVLQLEPRHFGALAGLGLILEELDRDDDALKAYRAALAIHPHLKNVQDAAKRLEVREKAREI